MQLQTRDAHLKGKSIKANGNAYAIDANLCVEVENDDDANKLLACGWTDEIIAMKSPKRVRGMPRVPPASLASAKDFVELVDTQPAIAKKCGDCQTFGQLQKLAKEYGYHFSESQLNGAREAYVARKSLASPPTGTDPQHAKLAADAATEPPMAYDDKMMVSPFGRYNRDVLADVSKKLGVAEPELLMAAYKVDNDGAKTGELTEAVLLEGAASLLPQGAVNPDAASTEATQAAGAESASGSEGEVEWPDPDGAMAMDYLREMADAYEVDHKGIKKKAELIEAIKTAMYPAEA